MRIIRHRVNTLTSLRALDPGMGAEIDLRSRGDEIILAHDAFSKGDSFERFASVWAEKQDPSSTLILNPKEDGLESNVLGILKAHGIENFFFLDLTIPTTVRLAIKEGMPKIAVRVSEFEPIEAAHGFGGKVQWVWIDSFSGTPPASELVATLSKEFRTCLVSPELQGFAPETIEQFKPLASQLTAVCTKHPEAWR